MQESCNKMEHTEHTRTNHPFRNDVICQRMSRGHFLSKKKKVSRRKHLSSPFCMQDYIICILRSIEMPVLSQKYSRFTRIHRLCLGNTSSKPHKSAYSKYTSAIFIARSGSFLQGKYPLRNLWLYKKTLTSQNVEINLAHPSPSTP